MTAANERWPNMGRWMAGEAVMAHLILADAKSICEFLRGECSCEITGPDPSQTRFDPKCPYHGSHGTMVATVPSARAIAESFASGDYQLGIVQAAEAKAAAWCNRTLAAEKSYRASVEKSEALRRERNRLIREAVKAGIPQNEIAAKLGLTSGRINQIISAAE